MAECLNVLLGEPQCLRVQRLLEQRARETRVAEPLVALGIGKDRTHRIGGSIAERVLGIHGEAREDLAEAPVE